MVDGIAVPVIASLAIGIAFIVVFAAIQSNLTSKTISQEPQRASPMEATNQFSSNENSSTVTITGEVVCLPHKSTGSLMTDECAVGLFAKDGSKKYYILDIVDERHSWILISLFILHEDSDELVNVTGTIKPEPNSKYDIAGAIEVVSAGAPSGGVSIFEVYTCHYEELYDILVDIKSGTGVEYDVEIAECSGAKEPCIRITFEKEVTARLTDMIPQEFEGYKVDVRMLDN